MPPVHPALVHFPIALVIASFIFDLLGYWRRNAALRAAAFWSLVAAAVSIALTVAAGYYDMNRAALGEAHDYVDFHLKVGWTLAIAVVGLTLWRWLVYRRAERSAGGGYLAAAFIVVLLTLFQGWFGGEMVYSQGAGVAAAGKGTEAPQKGRERLEAVMRFFGAGHSDHGGQQEHEHQ